MKCRIFLRFYSVAFFFKCDSHNDANYEFKLGNNATTAGPCIDKALLCIAGFKNPFRGMNRAGNEPRHCYHW